MKSTTLTAALVATICGIGTAAVDGIPGMRGHDHTGLTVPDMKQAVDFFTNVIGCKVAISFGPFADDKGTFMQDPARCRSQGGDPPDHRGPLPLRSNIELFDYSAPDQKELNQRNSDIGAFHIALYVDDIAAAKAYLDSKGVATHIELTVKEGPAAGQTILYFQAPWGLQFDAISYPDGMAHEKGAETVLWSPKDPAK
jgi:catechol 2,3-dioxygenase-like lactoylglutathione lyase family enzyme